MDNVTHFDRHNYFSADILSYHAKTIRMVEDWFLDREESIFNELTNKLTGIYDGYLYSDLISLAEWEGLSTDIVMRIRAIEQFIKDKIKNDQDWL
jgi:hypothetical protein